MSGNGGNLKRWLLKQADGEKILGVVIGIKGWYEDEYSEDKNTPKGTLLNWEEATKYIDYDFDAGYGGVGCHSILAWTKSWVITVGQYDGATWPYRLPRNPINIMPNMEGG